MAVALGITLALVSVRDDVSDALAKAGYEGFSATVTETSLDYGWHVRHRQETV